MSKLDKVMRIGIAGIGIAVTDILPFLLKNPQVQVTAVADTRKEAVDQFVRQYQAEGYYSVEDMCKSKSVDVVYVCTPNHMHCEHVIIAAEHHKDIIVEKPMSLSMEECERMNQAVERNGVRLLCGHTHSFDPPIQRMQEIVASGELGNLMMINSLNFTDFMYRPRMPHELDTKKGGGAVFIQGPHQIDIIRQIAGRKLRSVRAMTGIYDPARKTEGMYVAYLEFEDGTPSTIVYNGYAHYDSAELNYWVAEVGRRRRHSDTNYQMRRLLQSTDDESKMKSDMRFGGTMAGEWDRLINGVGEEDPMLQPFFGLTIVSCENGDIRQSENGLTLYKNDKKVEVALQKARSARDLEINEMHQAIVNDKPVFHNGRWGQATLEVCLAIYESAKEKKEIILKQQV